MPLSVRPAQPQDELFLYQLVYQSLYEQLCAWAWDPNIRDQLLDLQIRAKCGSYLAEFPQADHAIIMLDDEPVGSLIMDRAGEFYVLVDIAIVSKHRGAGIGTRIILGLCTEAALMQKKVRLQVSVTNPRATSLYRRLGFRVIEDHQVTLEMERAAGDIAQVIAAP